MKEKNNKKILIIAVTLLLVISIGFAYLSTSLNFNGLFSVDKASFNVYLDNVDELSTSTVSATKTPEIIDSTTVEFEVDLEVPKDKYTFNVDVVNDGTLDAIIDPISITSNMPEELRDYITFEVNYLDGSSVDEEYLLEGKTTTKLNVNVEFNDTNKLPYPMRKSETKESTIRFRVDIAPSAVTNESTPQPEIAKSSCVAATGDGKTVGDKITCGTENFYVVDYNNETNEVSMLAEYNLDTGIGIDENIYGPNYNKIITFDRNASNKQDVNANRLLENWVEKYAIYFQSQDMCLNINYIDQTPDSMGYYKIDLENTFLYPYLKKYEDILKNEYRLTTAVSSLLTGDIIDKLNACSGKSCDTETYGWMFNTDYWLGSTQTFYNEINGTSCSTEIISKFGVHTSYESTTSKYEIRPMIIFNYSQLDV